MYNVRNIGYMSSTFGAGMNRMKRVTSWTTLVKFLTLWSLFNCVHSQGFFVHSDIVDGKHTVVTTVVNGTSVLNSSPPQRHNGEPQAAKFEIPLSSADQKWLESLLFIPGQGDKRFRKEYRQLSKQERDDLNLAFNLLKNDTSVSLNKYDLLANIHARSSANANAHKGPNFLGWHRVFLLMIENALRQKINTVSIPYWDVTLDEDMDKPYNSIIWLADFMGGGNGVVKDGAFSNWETQFGYGPLMRFLGAQGKLMSKEDVENILSPRHLGDITNPRAGEKFNIEEIHNQVHVWIGGQMKTIEIAAFDPLFYLLHAFTDNIWSEFRSQQKKDSIDPTADYPEYYGLSTHSPFAPMALGNVMVLDGISDKWNENVLYTARQTCNQTFNGCSAPFVKCDFSKWRCISKSMEEVEYEQHVSNVSVDMDEISGNQQKQKLLNSNILTNNVETKFTPFNQLNSTFYRNFQGSIAVLPKYAVYEVVKASEVYQLYSDLTAAHTDAINLILFFILSKCVLFQK